MKLLVIGGTVFVGRATVDAALARGHEVTIFHRGEHGEDVHPDIEHLHGDRGGDLAALRDRSWDAVVDSCGFTAEDLERSASALTDDVEHYTFVSSVSVYRDWPGAVVTEQSAVKDVDDKDTYGGGKVAAERALAAAFGGRVLVTRPGLIVGPHENINRLPAWLERVAAGGEVLAPGRPDDARQWVDARDLAEFTLDLAEQRATGTFSMVSRPGTFTMGEVLEACRTVTGSDATFRWVDGEHIVAAGIAPWTQLPIWIYDPDADTTRTWDVDSSAAHAAGFRSRPILETVRDTWEWLQSGAAQTDYRSEYAVPPFDRAKEAQALRLAG